ncbi:MAG: TetR/AcrR family transcriptional regulator [Actinomycetota bacterium]
MSSAAETPSTREAILLEAGRLFAETGYDGTSLNDIAAGVGIRRPSLLHHFASKEDLYAEVFEELLSGWLERLNAALVVESGTPGDIARSGTAPQGWAMVESTLVSGFGFLAEHPDFVRLIQREALDHGSRVGVDLVGVLRPLFDRAAEYFRREMERGTFRPIDPEQLLLTGWGILMSYFSEIPFVAALTDEDPLQEARLERRLQHILDLFRVALLAD